MTDNGISHTGYSHKVLPIHMALWNFPFVKKILSKMTRVSSATLEYSRKKKNTQHFLGY